MVSNEKSTADIAQSLYLLVGKTKESNAAISRMLSDTAAQLEQGKPRLEIVSGSTYGYSSTVLEQPEYWTKNSFGFVMSAKDRAESRVPSKAVIISVQYHHETVIDRAELWFAIAKTEKMDSLSYLQWWTSVDSVKKWSDKTLPAYGDWSAEKTYSHHNAVGIRFNLSRQPLNLLQDSSTINKLVVQPILSEWRKSKWA